MSKLWLKIVGKPAEIMAELNRLALLEKSVAELKLVNTEMQKGV